MNESLPLGVAHAPSPRFILRQATSLGGTQLVGLLSVLVRNRVNADVTGVEGIGLLAQLSVLVLLIAGIASLGLGNGSTLLIAAADSSDDLPRLRKVVSFVVGLPVLAGTAFALVGSALAGSFSGLLLGSEQHKAYVIAALLAVPPTLLVASLQIVQQGLRRAGRLAGTTLLASAVGTALAVALAVRFGLNGAAWGLPAAAWCSAAVYVLRERRLVALLGGRLLDAADLRTMVTLGGASFAASLLLLGSDSGLRSALLARHGVTENGLYQPAYLLSAAVFAPLASALTTVLMPTVSAVRVRGGHQAARRLVGHATVLAAIWITAFACLAAVLGSVLISMLFGADFEAGNSSLVLQMGGELPRILSYGLGAALLPAGRIRAWFAINVLLVVARCAVAIPLLGELGKTALAASYVAEWTVAAIATALVAVRGKLVAFERRELSLLSLLVLILSVVITLTLVGAPLLAAAVALAGMGCVVRAARSEVERHV
ncbi:MAG: hypothetical protein JWM02_371 [Frankiales bacterium]|nr:hypothetical protein [Frankiales bacterium]